MTHIYPSSRVLPYVYICTHKETGQFYIGYRAANVKLQKPSHLDLQSYKTSSKIVKPDFENYLWYIVAEFYDKDIAYDFEQQLIHENWGNPLLLNKSCHYKKSRFKCPTGIPCSTEKKNKIGSANKIKLTGITRSEEFKQKVSKANKGKVMSQETRDKLSKIVSDYHKATPRQVSDQTKEKLRIANKGRTMSEEQKKKISDAKRQRDKKSPMSQETKDKIALSLKKVIRSDDFKQKISIANKGKVISAEQRSKISNAQKERQKANPKQITAEHREKISKALSGRLRPEEVKRRISETKRLKSSQ